MSKVVGKCGWVAVVVALCIWGPGAVIAAEPDDPEIVNGSVTPDFPAVGQLVEYLPPELPASDGLGVCTVTLVGCSTAVTAAHCVCDPVGRQASGADCQPGESAAPDPDQYGVFLPNLGLRDVASIDVHPDYDPEANFDNDLAVLRLVGEVAGIRPLALATGTSPESGTSGLIVGFGVGGAGTALGAPGIKRQGDVVVSECSFVSDKQFCTEFEEPLGSPGDNAAPCDADGGAPLLIDEGGTPVVSGIASYHEDASGNCTPPSESHYVDVAAFATFLQASAPGDLSTDACGAYLQAGEAGAQSNYWLNNLPGFDEPESAFEDHSFEVPSGTSRLIVALNGEQFGSFGNQTQLDFTDFDLEVWRNAAPSTILCSAADDSVIESCDEIFLPEPGTWTARVTRYSFVGGEYQLNATYLLPESGGPPSGVPLLVSSILPTSRSVEVGAGATAYATVLNAGLGAAESCTLTLGSEIPGILTSWQTNPATNAVIGPANPAVAIPVGGAATWAFQIVVEEELPPTDVELIFDCENSSPASVYPGINTLLLSASSTPTPDVVALALTATGDGVLAIDGPAGSGAFVTASINLGSSAVMDVTATASDANLPVDITICQSNPATAVCLAPPSSVASLTIGAGATPTFSIFATARGNIALDPANNRVYIEFRDAGGAIRGSTSVAVKTTE